MNSNQTNYILHFTLGPVQPFVGQARRTRDLWAGSFLLSWLTGQAINAVIKQGGEIEFPVVRKNGITEDPLLKAIRNETGHSNPEIGTLPNRFKASFTEQPTPEQIEKVSHAVSDKWEALAYEVWREYVRDIADNDGNNTQTIWHKQISNFWEINWVLVENPNDKTDGKWLDLRKNWRSHWPEEQGGDHCTLMGDWQEISGHIRSQNRDEQKTFWDKIRKQHETDNPQKTLGYLELREGERLCAISLVKRLFPRLSKQSLEKVIGWIPGGNKEAVGNWPSSAYISTIPWLSHINNTEDDSGRAALNSYANTVKTELKNPNTFSKLCSERATQISKLKKLKNSCKISATNRDVTDLDGNLFHLDTLQNHRNTPLSDEDQSFSHDPDKLCRNKLITELNKVNKAIGNKDAQPFYSLLVMDGDNMGKLLQAPDIDDDGIKAISESLMDFSQKAKTTVEEHQGILLYSGGDDVLAMLPITTAIECSIALRNDYTKAFEEKREQLAVQLDNGKISASAAIIYTHLHSPLNKVLKQGHHALDNIAKEQNGRNSLCLTIFKPEGVTARWVGSYKTLAGNIQTLIRNMQEDEDSYSASFFYNLKSRYPMLYNKDYDPPSEEDKKALLLAEYCKGKNIKKQEQQVAAKAAINILINACGVQKGTDDDITLEKHLQLDAAYIARFVIDTGYNFGRARGQNEQLENHL